MYFSHRCIKGDAKTVLKDYSTKGGAFAGTLDHIKEAYNNKKRIISEHLTSLFDFTSIKVTSIHENLKTKFSG